MAATTEVPDGWDKEAHASWLRSEREEAIRQALGALNTHPKRKPLRLILQFAHYVFHSGDPASAAGALELARRDYPNQPQLLLNLAVCLSRSGQHPAALARIQEVVALQPDNVRAHDTLSETLHRLGRHDEAARAGTRSLVLKNAASPQAPADWQLPDMPPAQWATMPGKRDVIAFSLWGGLPRYVRGALDNALAVAQVYPGWTPLIYVDDTVPEAVRGKLAELGCDIRMEPAGQPTRDKLAWRFKPANDPQVGRFLVRDIDSVVNPRERAAVDAWLASDRWFHSMRDWWTHTDLLLAGMWGGVAGVLPELMPLLDAYRPPDVETRNVDQWFLRDVVWPYVRTSCLVHDRYFTPPGAQPWPVPHPVGNYHVGQNENAARAPEQEMRLAEVLAGL